MQANFPCSSFESAVSRLVVKNNIIYGNGKSALHVEVPEDRDSGSIFSGADAEAQFYELLGYFKYSSPEIKHLFANVASEFLVEYEYTFETAFHLAILNAMIVGRNYYKSLNNNEPIDTAEFVYSCMEDGPEHALSAH